MKVRHVILESVNNFEHFDLSLEDEWTEEVPGSLLLIGPNGSGKTTLLNVIAGLWESFGEWLDRSAIGPVQNRPSTEMSDLIPPDSKLAAVEFIGLEKEPFWIFFTSDSRQDSGVRSLINKHSRTHRVVIERHRKDPESLKISYFSPGAHTPLREKDFFRWLDNWQQRFTENVLGTESNLPNVVFLESEERRLVRVVEPFQTIRETDEFRWLARYEPISRRRGSLENYLFNLSAVDKAAFEQVLKQTNEFLINKRIAGFDSRTKELMVEAKGPDRHSIDQLSSGEKQVLLMVVFITRWLRPGGIVLIDEPDLHLHVSWTNALVSHLRRIVTEQSGQLITASHAPELWQRFTPSHRVELGDLVEIQR